jgi:hypothetical protein
MRSLIITAYEEHKVKGKQRRWWKESESKVLRSKKQTTNRYIHVSTAQQIRRYAVFEAVSRKMCNMNSEEVMMGERTEMKMNGKQKASER